MCEVSVEVAYSLSEEVLSRVVTCKGHVPGDLSGVDQDVWEPCVGRGTNPSVHLPLQRWLSVLPEKFEEEPIRLPLMEQGQWLRQKARKGRKGVCKRARAVQQLPRIDESLETDCAGKCDSWLSNVASRFLCTIKLAAL